MRTQPLPSVVEDRRLPRRRLARSVLHTTAYKTTLRTSLRPVGPHPHLAEGPGPEGLAWRANLSKLRKIKDLLFANLK